MDANGPVFVVRTIVSDIDDFSAVAEQAARLKKYGRVEMTISGLAEKARYEMPEGGNAWHEYASHNPALHKFFPHPEIAPFIPAEYVEKNRRALDARLKILRDLDMGACFWAGEPAFLPEEFFRANPHLRGPRVDHPRRSRHEVFAPCIDHPDNLEMWSWMMAELVKHVPQLGTFSFKTNDAGSGICWADWLYSGPNGPAACRNRSTGERVAGFMQALRDGANRAGGEVQIFMTPQFRPGEIKEIMLLLPEGCHLEGRRRTDDSIASVGCSMLNACYPVKGILDPLPVIRSASKIDLKTNKTVFLNARVFYNRDVELIEVWKHVLDIIEKCIDKPVSGLMNTIERLQALCTEWANADSAEELMETLVELAEALRFQFAAMRPLSTIYLGVSLRHVTRPLVPVPSRLSAKEEEHWLKHVFNIWPDQAREDYLDLHGGRWEPVPIVALGPYLRQLERIAETIERISKDSDDKLLRSMPTSLRLHAAILRSCGNFYQMQLIRDRNGDKLSQITRPSKEGNWTGDNDLQSMNALMRDELDNTQQLIDLVSNGGLELLAHATKSEDEDTFLFGPNLVEQLQAKYAIMRDHWIDIEDYMASPAK